MGDALQASLRDWLATQDVEAAAIAPDGDPHCWHISGTRWVPLTLPGRAAPLYVGLPVSGAVRRGASGAFSADWPAPAADELDEAAAFARSVLAHGQVGARGVARGGATHEIAVDAAGRERLVRRRFSAR